MDMFTENDNSLSSTTNRRRSYDAINDRYLRDYFTLPQVKNQLCRVGLMTKDGRVLTDEEYKRATIRRQQRWAARQQLAHRMAMDARDSHLARQLELQKQLQAVSRVEFYRKMRGETAKHNLVSITPLEVERTLSRSQSAPSYRSPYNRSSAGGGSGSGTSAMPPLMISPENHFNSSGYHTDDENQRPRSDYPERDDEENRAARNKRALRRRYMRELDGYQFLHRLDNDSLERYDSYLRLQLGRLERARLRPFTYTYADDDEITQVLSAVEPEAGLPEIPDRPIDSLYDYRGSGGGGGRNRRSQSNRPRWRHLEVAQQQNRKVGVADDPSRNGRSRSQSPRKEWNAGSGGGGGNKSMLSRLYVTSAAAPGKRRRQPQASCECRVQYLGPAGEKPSTNDEPSPHSISISQQHCGGNTINVFTGELTPKARFDFVSYRQRGYPFSLNFTEDGQSVLRVSTCCESRYAVGTRLGGKKGQFRWLGVVNAVPCYKCQMYRGTEAPYTNYTDQPIADIVRKKKASRTANQATGPYAAKPPRPQQLVVNPKQPKKQSIQTKKPVGTPTATTRKKKLGAGVAAGAGAAALGLGAAATALDDTEEEPPRTPSVHAEPADHSDHSDHENNEEQSRSGSESGSEESESGSGSGSGSEEEEEEDEEEESGEAKGESGTASRASHHSEDATATETHPEEDAHYDHAEQEIQISRTSDNAETQSKTEASQNHDAKEAEESGNEEEESSAHPDASKHEEKEASEEESESSSGSESGSESESEEATASHSQQAAAEAREQSESKPINLEPENTLISTVEPTTVDPVVQPAATDAPAGTPAPVHESGSDATTSGAESDSSESESEDQTESHSQSTVKAVETNGGPSKEADDGPSAKEGHQDTGIQPGFSNVNSESESDSSDSDSSTEEDADGANRDPESKTENLTEKLKSASTALLAQEAAQTAIDPEQLGSVHANADQIVDTVSNRGANSAHHMAPTRTTSDDNQSEPGTEQVHTTTSHQADVHAASDHPIDHVVIAAQDEEPNTNTAGDLWYCKICNFDNDHSAAKCRICGVARDPNAPVAADAVADADANAAQTVMHDDPDAHSSRSELNVGPWTCKICNFDNDNDLSRCRVCGVPRSTSESVPTGGTQSPALPPVHNVVDSARVVDEVGKETDAVVAEKPRDPDEEDTLADAESIRNELSDRQDDDAFLKPTINVEPPSTSPSALSTTEEGQLHGGVQPPSPLPTDHSEMASVHGQETASDARDPSQDPTTEKKDDSDPNQSSSEAGDNTTQQLTLDEQAATAANAAPPTIALTNGHHVEEQVIEDEGGERRDAVSAKLKELCSKDDVVISNIELDSAALTIITNELKQNPHMRSLSIRSSHLTDDALASIDGTLLSLGSIPLKALNFNMNYLSSASVPRLIDMVRRYEIESLLLRGNKIGDESMANLFGSLQTIDSIQKLDVGENDLSKSSARTLSTLIGSTTKMQALSLGGNSKFDSDDWNFIAKGLKSNTTLETINFDYCRMGDEALETVCMALKSHSNLRSLDLDGNDITDRGATAVLDLVDHLPNMSNVVWLSGNQVSSNAASAVRQILSTRK